MKKVMVISDTHEDMATMRMVLDYLKNTRVDMVIHLGDYYNDSDLLEKEGYPLIKVPGTWDPHYYDRDVPNRKFIDVAGWKVFLTHTPESHYNDLDDDLKPEMILHRGESDLFLYGHTHRAEIKRRKGVIMINPGHMSCDEHRGCPLTFALLDIHKEDISVSLRQLFNDDPFLEKKFEKTSLKYEKRLIGTANRASFS